MDKKLIVHPVRSRVVSLLMGRRLTTAQIHELMPDVPLPSLYRHIRQLTEGGAIEVVDSCPVRGVIERTYALRSGGGLVERGPSTAQEEMELLVSFTAVMTQGFQAYLEAASDRPDPAYERMFALYLSPEEEASFQEEIHALLSKYQSFESTESRRRKVFAALLLPDLEKP